MAIEKRRGCGYRKVGGLYLVGTTGIWVPCDRLPILLDVCPACGGGIKPGLGFTWMSPRHLLETDHLIEKSLPYPPSLSDGDTVRIQSSTDGGANEYFMNQPCGEKDILCLDPPKRAGLMWVGTKFYSPQTFIQEAKEQGVSKRIPAIPKQFVVGETWVILAHRQAAKKTFAQHEFNKKDICECGIAKNGFDTVSGTIFQNSQMVKCERKMPGIFSAFKPDRIEKLVDEDTPQEEIEDLEKRGITVIKVPKDDKDHHGSVYDKQEEEVPPSEELPPLLKASIRSEEISIQPDKIERSAKELLEGRGFR